jgi:hypothetical protein
MHLAEKWLAYYAMPLDLGVKLFSWFLITKSLNLGMVN